MRPTEIVKTAYRATCMDRPHEHSPHSRVPPAAEKSCYIPDFSLAWLIQKSQSLHRFRTKSPQIK
jgi:hypothetical protein